MNNLAVAWAQAAYQVPLGAAAQYGLLSAASITAQRTTAGSSTPTPIQTGKAGANLTIDAGVAATNGVFAAGNGTVPQALSNLAAARSYCANQGGTDIDVNLSDRTLGGGSYVVADNAALASSSSLTLTGNTATVIIFNIAGSLTVASQAHIVLNGVLPQHVFWNITGNLLVGDRAGFRGVALLAANAQATLTGFQFGNCALLSGGSITLLNLSTTVGHNKFYAAQRPADACQPGYPGQACAFTRPGSELLLDGSFEVERCCPIYGSGLDMPSSACFWQSATAGSSDYYHSCANNNPYTGGSIGMPYNYWTQYITPGASGNKPVYALAQNSQAATGTAYVGSYAYLSGISDLREYVYQQVVGSVQANKRYYAEFSACLAPMSNCAVPTLGMLVGPATLPYPNLSSDKIIPLAPTISGSAGGLPAPTSRGWQRIGGVFTSSTTLVNPKVIIGNFGSDAQAITPPGSGGAAYYFIDNATLSPLTEAGPPVALGDCLGSGGPASVTLGTAPMPALVGATYAWTSSDGSFASTQPNPSVSPTVTTTYFLTVSIPGQPPYTSQATVTVYGSYGQNPGATYASTTGAPYEIGTPGTVTYINASSYGGKVTFDGQYHVLGTVYLINGLFELAPGTVFFMDGDSGLPYDSGPATNHIALVVQEAELHLEGATLQANCPKEQWAGVWLYGNAVARTGQSVAGLRSRICHAETGINSRAGNQYYLADTDFEDNSVGLYELSADKVAQAGEGAQGCAFRGEGLYGIVIEGSDYRNGVVSGGDYDEALFANNEFANLDWMGLYVSAGKGHFVSNTFRNCGWAGMSTWAMPQLGPSEFSNNYIQVPGSSFANSYAGPMGIYLNDHTTRLTGNTIEGMPLTAGALPRTGVFYQNGMQATSPNQVTGNTIRSLEEGLATPTDDYNGSAISITKNTFVNNAAHVVFYPCGTQNYGIPVTATIRCNSFINDAASTVSQPIGIWLKSGAVINSGLGSATSSGNGNEFPIAQWGPGTNSTSLVNDNTSAVNRLYYTRLNTNNETVVASSNVALNTDMTTAPAGACGGTSPGVNSRQYTALPTAITTILDSLRVDNLTASQQGRLLTELRSQPVPTTQLSTIEELLSATRLSTTSHVAAGIHLFSYYREQHDQVNAIRLRNWLIDNQPNDKGELVAYLRVTQALDQMSSFLPGFQPLAEANRQLLQQAAASGTTSARLACQLLRAYEPACACVLPVENRPISSAQPIVTAASPHALLAAYPNPANAIVHVPYALPAGLSEAELVAYDAVGRVVLRQVVPEQQGELAVATQTWPTGLYQLALLAGGRVIGAQRIAITSY